MSVILKSREAEEDLIHIWLYGYKNWGESQADKYLDGMEASIKLIVEKPLLCRLRDEFSPPVRVHIYSKHLIVYVEIESGINILRVLHASMDVSEQLL